MRQRASTSEGKIQVELAQLKYQQTRLAGFGKAMSRLEEESEPEAREKRNLRWTGV